MAILLLFIPAVPHHHHFYSGSVKLGECVKFSHDNEEHRGEKPSGASDSCVAKAPYLAAAAQTKLYDDVQQPSPMLAVLAQFICRPAEISSEILPPGSEFLPETGIPLTCGLRAPPYSYSV